MSTSQAIRVILDAFEGGVNLVGLGERHWSREGARLRLALLKHPEFAAKVDDIA